MTHIHSYSDDHIARPKMHSTPTHIIKQKCSSTINRASTVFIELKSKNEELAARAEEKVQQITNIKGMLE